MQSDEVDSLICELELSHRRELDLLRVRLDDLTQRVESELSGLEERIEKQLEKSEMRLAREVTNMAIKQAFSYLDVDIDNQESRIKFRDDIRFGGLFRDAAMKGFYAMVAAVVGVIGMSIGYVFKDYLGLK